MSNGHGKKKCSRECADLIKQILEVRYTDLEEEKNLCDKLMVLSEAEEDTYSNAFANVYMLDCLLPLGDYANCGFYLVQAVLLCRENSYNDLLLILCNLAGLYYTKLNDEQTALQFYLGGLKLAGETGDGDTESKLLNNIGFCFGGREDWDTAKFYFSQAVKSSDRNKNNCNTVSYLCNLAEMCQNLGDYQGSEQALKQCETMDLENSYQRIRLECARCNHYTMLRDLEQSRQCEKKLMDMGFLEYENKFFVDDMCISICECMINTGQWKRAFPYISFLENRDTALQTKFHILDLKIRYWAISGEEKLLDEAYREYYEIERRVSLMDDRAGTQSILSRIQLMHAQMERENMRQENRELENAGQFDSLTGLYNRRYMNKLIDDAALDADVKMLGFIMLDVDYFKQYNDNYGHVKGDQALRALGEILDRYGGNGIYPGRYGGDEFMCLCLNLTDPEVEAYIKSVEVALNQKEIPHQKSGCSSVLTLSIGYCNEPCAPGTDMEALLQLADQALYQSKQDGRNRYSRKSLIN